MCHLRDGAVLIEPAHPGQVVIVSDDDLAVAGHVQIEFDIGSGCRGGGAERFLRIFGVRAGTAAMPDRSRAWEGEEVGVDVIAHGMVLIREVAISK